MKSALHRERDPLGAHAQEETGKRDHASEGFFEQDGHHNLRNSTDSRYRRYYKHQYQRPGDSCILFAQVDGEE